MGGGGVGQRLGFTKKKCTIIIKAADLIKNITKDEEPIPASKI